MEPFTVGDCVDACNATAAGPAISLEAKIFLEEWPPQGADNYVLLGINNRWDSGY